MFPFLTRFSLQTAILIFIGSVPLHAQSNASTTRSEPGAVSPVSAKVLTGWPGAAPDTEGDLSFDTKSLRFITERSSGEIPKSRIIAVSGGDEQIETGGKAGRIARVVIPYGGGLALGAVTHKKVGLLTIEFLDASGEYHGAVFELQAADMPATLEKIAFQPSAGARLRAAAAVGCPEWKIQANAVRVQPIDADQAISFPAEDRVLLYENLVRRLESEKTIQNVYRAGDQSPEAGCAEFTVTVRATAFGKGNQAARASVGPLGHFIGTTKLNFHLTISKQDGSPNFDVDLKKSEGSDTDSLNITKVVSKTVVKNLKKSRTQMRKTEMS
ncbi:hypothetical protein HNQ77_000627 [Silvibacterium bohemicum]|uniref:Uncharacterized protein n=1 Tax=Silvibacterium bohemicum TaxID=1577686 RepID=A0A841JSE3_9BACT|nr:hypothetical protein [Silvibacterium bohemicum]MBB6142689.1 hypothetical protein [Silvibacterium bohemicum]